MKILSGTFEITLVSGGMGWITIKSYPKSRKFSKSEYDKLAKEVNELLAKLKTKIED